MAENEKDLEKGTEAKTEVNTDESEDQQPKKKKSNILIIAVLILFVVIVGMVGFLVLRSGDEEKPKEVEKTEVITPPVFYSLKELVVSLSGNTSNIRYLKLVLDFELEKAEDQTTVEQLQPKIIDEYQTYLRQLRLEDLRGSIGTYRLKEALLLRANQIVQPVQIKDVLIKEMLIQ